MVVNSSIAIQSIGTSIHKVITPVADSQATPVSFRVASVEVGQVDGQVIIEWDTDDKREAILDDEPCASGKTKKVYRVRLSFILLLLSVISVYR